jgi:hypothetical protein
MEWTVEQAEDAALRAAEEMLATLKVIVKKRKVVGK